MGKGDLFEVDLQYRRVNTCVGQLQDMLDLGGLHPRPTAAAYPVPSMTGETIPSSTIVYPMGSMYSATTVSGSKREKNTIKMTRHEILIHSHGHSIDRIPVLQYKLYQANNGVIWRRRTDLGWLPTPLIPASSPSVISLIREKKPPRMYNNNSQINSRPSSSGHRFISTAGAH